MVLVDTSVWVSHFRKSDDRLVELLSNDSVLTHPFVIGEIACGTPPSPRLETLASLRALKEANQASYSEIMDFIERDRLYEQGCGWVDVSLLASALLTSDTRLWTLDRSLNHLALRMGIAY